jgi:hypothetical protein
MLAQKRRNHLWYFKVITPKTTKEVSPMKIVAAELEICKARDLLDRLVTFIQEATQQGLRADQVERHLFDSLLGIGHELMQAFIKQAGDGDEGAEVEHHGQTLKRSQSMKTRLYRCIFGVIEVARFVYASRAKQKAEYLPIDQALGLPKGEHSYVLEDWLQQFCVQRPFTNSVNSLAELLHCSVSTRSAERMNRDMSGSVEEFRTQTQVDQEEIKKDDLIIVSADGKGVPMRRPIEERVPEDLLRPWRRHYRKKQLAGNVGHTDKRRRRGQKPGQKQMAYVGAVYSIEPFPRTSGDVVDDLRRQKKAEKRPTPKNKRVWAEMTQYFEDQVQEGQPQLFMGLAYEIQQRDPSNERTVVCLMDGQRSLWGMKEKWLSRAVSVLDIFHAMERLWKAVYCFHQEGSQEAEQCVTHYLEMLLDGKVGYLIGVFRRRLPLLTGSKRKELSKIIQFFENNRHYMRYDEYLKKGYPIGSGVVEGACRHLVRDRMECTGMHWELEGAQAMLNTRSVYLSGQWNEFIEYRIQKEQAALYANAA